ncbi:hypothetical protein DFA_05092 [Cavenderia fasciculata]|uniref:Uncharacterized protein n=1 Tax=Cavenderia fasciculata TaxID=261658 RepID=F4PNA9_CACFS|nr:uncharacterized protein DFA_05092 [Cavenderia fasciculata]EGG22962.1 hypothetical protein DFA_05092 [Cavenderia fasciculata]|eukprot:XP_004360813.1 hypothetical protein DFA_05092 [Cavenderia fasciculata]
MGICVTRNTDYTCMYLPTRVLPIGVKIYQLITINLSFIRFVAF